MNNKAQIFLAVFTAAGFFMCIMYMLNWEFPEKNKDALNSLLGVLTTIFTLQMNFFFGSSSASKSKDETISTIAKSAATSTAQTTEGDINVTPTGPVNIIPPSDVSITPPTKTKKEKTK